MKSLRNARTLTSKAMDEYRKRVSEIQVKLTSTSSKICDVIDSNQSVSDETSLTTLCSIKQALCLQFEEYEKIYTEFTTYLSSVRTEESSQELETLQTNDGVLRDSVSSFLQAIDSNYQRLLETRLHKSVHSNSKSMKSGSNTSKPSVVAIKQAKAEAARIKVSFAEQEASIKLEKSHLEEQEKIAAATADRKKTDLEIKLQLLNDQKNYAAAEAEAQVLEGSWDGS